MIAWADTWTDRLSVARATTRKRCPYCPKGARRRATHNGLAGPVAMATLCEWHAYAWLRNARARLRGR